MAATAAAAPAGAREAHTKGGVVTDAPFGQRVRDLLLERGYSTAIGNANYAEFARKVDTFEYETLRKAVAGERRPTPGLMESVAAALDVDPAEAFVEYRLWLAQRQFDPREVGLEAALQNLEAWTRKTKRRA